MSRSPSPVATLPLWRWRATSGAILECWICCERHTYQAIVRVCTAILIEHHEVFTDIMGTKLTFCDGQSRDVYFTICRARCTKYRLMQKHLPATACSLITGQGAVVNLDPGSFLPYYVRVLRGADAPFCCRRERRGRRA